MADFSVMLDDLNDDEVYEIMEKMDRKSLLQFCRSSRRTRRLCSVRSFWASKYKRDFPASYKEHYKFGTEIDWKKLWSEADTYDVYGVISNDGSSLIVDKTNQKSGSRTILYGKDCKTWTLRMLIPIMYKINYDYPAAASDYYNVRNINEAIGYVSDPATFKKLGRKLETPGDVRSWNKNKIRYYYAWLKFFDVQGRKSKFNKEFLCGEISRKMQEQGRINTYR